MKCSNVADVQSLTVMIVSWSSRCLISDLVCDKVGWGEFFYLTLTSEAVRGLII